jgi:hypothetical protein
MRKLRFCDTVLVGHSTLQFWVYNSNEILNIFFVFNLSVIGHLINGVLFPVCYLQSCLPDMNVDSVHQCFSTVGRDPVPDPGINYTGPREILLEFVILVF